MPSPTHDSVPQDAPARPVYSQMGDQDAIDGLIALGRVPGWVPIAVDTETNGLYADDLARLSVVSVAWVDPEVILGPPGGLWRAITTGENVHSAALPFSQGKWIGRTGSVKAGQASDEHDEQRHNPNLTAPIWELLHSRLAAHPLVFHNSKFDLQFLRYLPIGWRASVEDCRVHGNLVLWKNEPADEAMWNPSATQTASANSANTKITNSGRKTGSAGSDKHAGSESLPITVASAPVVVRPGWDSSNSITSTVTAPFIEPKSAQARTATEQATPPTDGLRNMAIQPGSKSYAQTATALRSVLAGAHPVTDCTCMLEGSLPDLEKLRFAPMGWTDCSGTELLDNWLWDTQVSSPEIWPGHTSSLKPTAARLWGVDSTAEAEAIKPYLGPKTDPRYDLVPWEVLGPYAAKDAELTIRLFYLQMSLTAGWEDEPWGYDPALLAQCRREVDVARVLYRMERAGIPYAAAESHQIGVALGQHKSELDKQLPFRPTDPAAKKWLFELDAQGASRAKPLAVTQTGAPSLTADVVMQLVGKHPEGTEVGDAMRLWLQRGKIATAAKMWYLPYAAGIGDDGRLRTCFRQVTRGRGTDDGGTRSGRFSVERVNLQAIPHDYRLGVVTSSGSEILTPRQLIGLAASRLEGWELWEFDLAQAELRTAAAWAGCEPMLSALRESRDLHSETTRELFGVSLEDPEWGHFRQIGKRANFTLCFGAGGATLARMVLKETGRVMSTYEANTLVRDWNDLYPQYRQAIRLWQGFVDQTGYVPLASVSGFASGRKRRFTPDEETHKAFNQLVQGSLAEFLKDWLLAAQTICDEAGLTWADKIGWTGLVLTIHDSLVVLLPKGATGEQVAAKIKQAAADLWMRYFNTPDPFGRVQTVSGHADAKRWGSD